MVSEGEPFAAHETKLGLRICCPICKRWRNYNITSASDGYVECVYCERLIPSNWEILLQKETQRQKKEGNITLLVVLIVLFLLLLAEAHIL